MLDVTKDDVEVVLGLPRGTIQINFHHKGRSSPLFAEWEREFKKPDHHKIRYPELIDEMKECTYSGVWFKCHFVVLVSSMFIEHPQNGYVGSQLLFGRCVPDSEFELVCICVAHVDGYSTGVATETK